MRPSRRRRRQRAGGALLATLVLALASLVAPGPTGAQEPEDPPEGEVRLTGIEATPWVTRAGTWNLELQVEGAPADGEVRAVIREQVDRAAYAATFFGVVEGDRKAAIPPVELATAPDAEGGGKAVSLAVTLLGETADSPGWKFLPRGLRPGVYPVEIEVLDGEGERRAGTVAFLTRVPSGEEAGADRPPLRIAPIVSLGAQPSVAPDGQARLPDGLVSQGQALVDGLALVPDLPLTLAPRPESIEALAREDETNDLLEGLAEVTIDRQVLDAPYVEIPLPAWVEAGLGDELTRQRARGNAVLTEQLGPVDSSTLLSPSGLTPATAAELWNVGVRTVVFNSLGPGSSAPPTRPFTIPAGEGRTLLAVANNDTLAAALTRRSDPVLDQSGLAAELALLHQGDGDPGGIALLAPPGWPSRPEDLAGVADVLLSPDAPVEVTTIAGLVAAVPAGPERPVPGVLLEDLGDQPDELRRARALLASYASMTGSDDPVVMAMDQRLLLSGTATLSPAARRRYLQAVTAATARGFDGVEAPPRQTVTLTSSDGTLPLTLRSSFEEPVQVVVELDAGTRIQFRDAPSQLVTLTPGINRIPVPVHARARGDTAVDITLRTPDGAHVLDEVRYTVRSTAISGIGLVLSIGAAAFLVLWWARHWRATRRARAAA